jgi:signal peptidase II
MLFIGIIIVIAATESVIKQVREQNGIVGERKPILGGKLYLTKYHNYGAFLNLGQKRPEFVRGLSMGLSIACTILFILSLGTKGKPLLKSGLSLLLGGAYSNTYDRMVRGYVVDYFGFQVKNEKIRNIVFNISDFCIMIGALISVLRS